MKDSRKLKIHELTHLEYILVRKFLVLELWIKILFSMHVIKNIFLVKLRQKITNKWALKSKSHLKISREPQSVLQERMKWLPFLWKPLWKSWRNYNRRVTRFILTISVKIMKTVICNYKQFQLQQKWTKSSTKNTPEQAGEAQLWYLRIANATEFGLWTSTKT